MNYYYDELRRLTAAVTEGAGGWGNTYGYDGFGNLLQKNVYKGSAPSLSAAVDGATNHIVGHTYDNAGNATFLGQCCTTYDYDYANRLIRVKEYTNAIAHYGYDPSNQRIHSYDNTGERIYFYGIDGLVMATYEVGLNYRVSYKVNWMGQPLADWRWDPGEVTLMAPDHLGSEKSATGDQEFYPYGEPRTGSSDTYATYKYAANTKVSYARNRYYTSNYGRFTTPDPYDGSAALTNPGSWNRYAYVLGNPVILNDPSGLGYCETLKNAPIDVFCTGGGGDIIPDPLAFAEGNGRGDLASMAAYDAYVMDAWNVNYLNGLLPAYNSSSSQSYSPAELTLTITYHDGTSATWSKTEPSPPDTDNSTQATNNAQPSRGSLGDLEALVKGYAALTHPLDLLVVNASMFLVAGGEIGVGAAAVAGGCFEPTPFQPATCTAGAGAAAIIVPTGIATGASGVDFFRRYTLPAFREWWRHGSGSNSSGHR